jgi:hypothetical protein
MIITQAPYNSAPLQSSLSALGLTPPLMGFVRFRLSAGSLRVSTPRSPEAPFGRAEPSARSCSAFAVSHRPDGFLHPGAAGLLRPAAGHEVRRVSVAASPGSPESGPANPRLSHDATHTLQRIPLVGSRTASPRPLPSCRYRSPRTPLRDRPASWNRSPSRLPCRVHSARGLPEHRALVLCLAGLASPALAGPVYFLPRPRPGSGPALRRGVSRAPSPVAGATRSGCRHPIPPKRHRALAHHPPGRRGGQSSWSCISGGRGPPGLLLAPDPNPPRWSLVVGCTQCAASSTLGACSPRLGAAVAPKCPHTVRCASSLSRVSAGGSFATWAALLSPSAMPLAVTLRPPARAGLCFATSRPPGSSGSEDPHSSV